MAICAKSIRVINVPLDLGASRRGTDAGPSAFRVAGLRNSLTDMGLKVLSARNISIPAQKTQETVNVQLRFKAEILHVCQRLAQETLHTLNSAEFPLVIGGDHSIAMGTVSGVSAYFKEKHSGLGLLWFDAHGDMNLPSTSPTGNIHGMPLAHLLGFGDTDLSSINGIHPAVQAKNVVLIGIRDIDPVEAEFIRASGITVFSMRDIDKLGMAEISRQALKVVNSGTAGFHLSFDLDGCDPQLIPGTGTTVPGGVSYREARLLLEECAADGRMTSMEVVELNPFLDDGNVSAERAVLLVQSALGRDIL